MLLGYPLNLDMPATVRTNDLQYYEVNINPLCIVFLLYYFKMAVNIQMSALAKQVMVYSSYDNRQHQNLHFHHCFFISVI